MRTAEILIMHGGTVSTEMNRLMKSRKDQDGFTLIEVLIVILLTGIMSAAITGVILYVLNVNMATANRMTAVRQVRNVGFWINPDFQMAESVQTGAGSGFPLTLSWQEWTTNGTKIPHQVVYTLTDMPSGGFKRLQREHKIDSVTDTITIVAEYIDSDQTYVDPDESCPFPDCAGYTYTLNVTANVGGQTETREYEVQPRPGSQ